MSGIFEDILQFQIQHAAFLCNDDRRRTINFNNIKNFFGNHASPSRLVSLVVSFVESQKSKIRLFSLIPGKKLCILL